MTKRWKDRIQVLVQTSGTYDAWGHLDAESWEVADEVWAEVRP
jgi:head-tail adaptor